MTFKILSVDDSKAVRIIVRKAFKSYDCEVVEATNGVEGVSAAQRENPDLILLDVTMPVMDGVEALSKLKADASTKGIPVIMLTAEAGRENVMKIAKMGIRDYIVKPFKEENLLEKVRRVIDIQPKSIANAPKKNAEDGIDIVVVENKPAIVKQLEDNLGTDKWRVHGVADATAGIDFCSKNVPDLAIISLTLPNDDTLNFFRWMRSQDALKYVPVYGMAVKTAEDEIIKAQGIGITQLVTKPIDFKALEMKIIKSLNLDVSDKYFKLDDEALVVTFPQPLTEDDSKQIDSYIKPEISEAVDNGITKVILDMKALEGVDMDLISLMANIIAMIENLGLKCGLVGNDVIIGECSGIEDSTEWSFYESIEEAKAEM